MHIAKFCPNKFAGRETGKGKINAVAGYSSDESLGLGRKKDNEFEIKLRSSKKMVKFIVDTGADVTVINRETAQRLEIDVRRTRRDFRGADGSKLEIHFKAYLPLISVWVQEV